MLAQTRRACHHAAVTVALAVSVLAVGMTESRQLADLPPALAATMREARGEAERLASTSTDASARAAAWGNLGMLYHAHRLRFLARDAYAAALAEAGTVRWRYLHGIAQAELGEIERAAHDFRLVTRATPDNMPAWYRLGVSLLLGGELAGAQTALDRARELDDDSALVLAALADVAGARGDHRAALGLLTRAVELEPEAGQLAYKLAMTHRALGDVERATAWLARSPENRLAPKIDDPVLLEVAQMSRSARFYEIAADWALGRGDLDAAIQALESAAALSPDDSALALKLAAVMGDVGRRDEAVAQVRRALVLDEDSSAAWYRLAWLLRSGGKAADTQVAEDAVGRALTIIDDARSRALAGAFAMRGERFGDAVRHYEALVALRPADAYGHYWLSMARLGAEDCRARQGFDEALRLRPDWGEAHIALARADALCGFADRALARAKTLRGARDDANTRITQAFADAAAGRVDRAKALATADSTHPDAAHLLEAMAAGRLPARPFAAGSDWWLPPEIR
ncbi:MAG: tetratricopeptide repeat protein [Gammaproteobacteria bacterium]|nr:tetratricopeptide repeat protein [Gammaproteobacteria bacterium]